MSTAYVSPLNDYTGRDFTNEELGVAPAGDVVLGGQCVSADALPAGLAIHDVGVVAPVDLVPRRLHGWPKPYDFSEAPRACFTPCGDLLMMTNTGIGHQWGQTDKRSELVAYRSRDNGATWSGPCHPWHVPYSEHAFNPLIPGDGNRIVAFMSDFHADYACMPHTGALGIRTSDDNGHTWSEVRRVVPANDPGMRGVYHIQGCETDAGTWLLGTYTIEEGVGIDGRVDYQYVLRSVDRGATWDLLPGPRPAGWTLEPWKRMLEGRIIHLGGGECLMLTRTRAGCLYAIRSLDDGLTWTEPAPTALVHPDSPPMVWHLSDGKTLLALIHNKPGGNCQARDELWCSLSVDRGHTWSEPRFLLANAAAVVAPDGLGWMNGQNANMEVCYADVVARDGLLHLFYSHAKRHVHYLQIPEGRLGSLPTRRELIG